MPGRPDIVLPGAKIAIFVDGCFWHACPRHGTLPKNNREWWETKLRRNVERDVEKDVALQLLGWTVIHIWEHDVTQDAADVVESAWRTRRG
jgi:DNA mismatch endonuclease (patch repair protein)